MGPVQLGVFLCSLVLLPSASLPVHSPERVIQRRAIGEARKVPAYTAHEFTKE